MPSKGRYEIPNFLIFNDGLGKSNKFTQFP
jgi:hypothetical protein